MAVKNIKKVLIIAPRIKEEAYRISKEIEDYISSLGIEISTLFIDSTNGNAILDKDIDLVIPLGGDGTVLYCARAALNSRADLLPVNLGSFGYITEIETNEWKEAFNEYIESGKNVSNRLMLKVTVVRDNKKIFTTPALNEAVICSSGIAKVVSLSLEIDNTYAGSFRSDGMICATPTGSTGYSLASGGPILDCELKALVITPICPFALSNRPLVTADKKITFTVRENQRTDICLTVDGQVYYLLEERDRIICEMNSRMIRIVNSQKRNFTEVVRDKLHWSGEMHNDRVVTHN